MDEMRMNRNNPIMPINPTINMATILAITVLKKFSSFKNCNFCNMSSNNVILLLGSNINFPEKNIDTAIELINNRLGSIIARSSKLMTDPVEFDSKNIFCNIAVLIKTEFSPVQLLKNIKEIEHEMGREEDSLQKGDTRTG
jgi:2-amino-4-hydroxy-6-hydroxymethyldihydropteridine diphosphokinase